MLTLEQKFKFLEADHAPGQELRQDLSDLNSIMRGEILDGEPVDFSHGDVDAFPPIPGSEIIWNEGFSKGADQAYTEYRGLLGIRERLAHHLENFTGNPIKADSELIITPGTQGALFLAIGATVTVGTKVAVVEPDYFANRKLVKFFEGEIVPIPLNYTGKRSEQGPDMLRLEEAFKNGTKVLVFSTPNNPTGIVYSKEKINEIASLAARYDVTVIVDQLYSRMLYSGEVFAHFCSCDVLPENVLTIMGPSKTESLSGFRLGVAFGTSRLIERMERLQAIVSLRASGYNQAALDSWFREPADWLENRISQHQKIRDALIDIFQDAKIITTTPQAGSYLFPQLPSLSVDLVTFVQLLHVQAKVIVTPGTEFGPEFTSHIRLNFSQKHEASVDAARRIVKMVDLYREIK